MKTWKTIGSTVRGTVHLMHGTPCQDFLSIHNDVQKHYTLACLADGHGSENCPFSDEGSRIAAETAKTLLASVFDTNTSEEAFAVFNAHKEIWIPKQLETQWKSRVREAHKEKERPMEEPFPYPLYGTTLLALAATEHFVFALQIGDGDILVMDKNASVKWMITPEFTTGSETYSLCMDQSWQYVRTHIFPLNGEDEPLMFLLSTDGYANSFSEPLGFIKAGSDIYHLWHENGSAFIEEHLEDWLKHSTANGSGDDITMALVYQED